MCVPRIMRMMGGALACPTSLASRGCGTFRTTKRHDAAVATANNTHETIPKGIMQTTATGIKGTRLQTRAKKAGHRQHAVCLACCFASATFFTHLYPYKQTHSASVRAFIPMQHWVVIHRMVGNTKANPQQM